MYRAWTTACRRVGPSLEDRCRAIRDVLRPSEVAYLAHAARRYARRYQSHLVEGVARYLLQLGIAYEHDPPRRDNWCSPRQTLWRQRGDCDDHAVLAASLLRAVGAHASVVLGWHGAQYHAWVAGRCECGRFFVLEPQDGRVWYEVPRGYDAEYWIAPEGCYRVDRCLNAVA